MTYCQLLRALGDFEYQKCTVDAAFFVPGLPNFHSNEGFRRRRCDLNNEKRRHLVVEIRSPMSINFTLRI